MPLKDNTRQSGSTPRTGNRCGHDPRLPRWFEAPSEHGERPGILIKFIERIRQFYEDPGRIPSLAHALLGRKTAADPQGEHRPRQMRSERREACCALLGAIAHYCDLPSLCLSVPQANGALLPVRLPTLADAAGLSLRRAERAMRDIVDAGLLKVFRRCELKEQGYVGHAAIRTVPTAVFGLFGLEARLRHDRQRISQQRIEKRNQATLTGMARMRISLQGAIGKLTGRDPDRVPPEKPILAPASQASSAPLMPTSTASPQPDASGAGESVREAQIRKMREILDQQQRPAAPLSIPKTTKCDTS